MYEAHKIIDKAFKEYLGDDKRQAWDEPLLLDYLNDGYTDVAQQAKWLQKTLAFDILPNTATPFMLPSDLVKIDYFINSVTKERIIVEKQTAENFDDKDKILLLGTHKFTMQSDVDTRAILTYYNTPEKLLKNSILELPDYVSIALVNYICYRAYAKDQSSTSMEKAQQHLGIYQTVVGEFTDTAFKSLQSAPVTTTYQGF